MSPPLYILGAGGLGREIAAAHLESGEGIRLPSHYQRASQLFLFDDSAHEPRNWHGITITNVMPKDPDAWWILGVGTPAVRVQMAARFQEWRVTPCLHASRHSTVTWLEFGPGLFVGRGAVLTVDIKMGQHVAVLNNAVVGHDCQIGDFTVICPGAIISGRCSIGPRCFIGANATILPDITIGVGAVVGAGAVVTKDVEPGQTVAGVPAKPRP